MTQLFHQEGDLVREYNETEYKQNAIDVAKYNAEIAANEAAIEQAATAKAALLDKLGITADEFKTLLGGN